MIISLYAGLLAILFIRLTFRVIKTRRLVQVAIGDGGDITLQRAIAVHNNFAQYTPFALLLIAMVEQQHAPTMLTHALGLSLCIGRLIHAHGVSQVDENFKFRQWGMIITLTCLLAAALTLISQFIYSTFF